MGGGGGGISGVAHVALSWGAYCILSSRVAFVIVGPVRLCVGRVGMLVPVVRAPDSIAVASDVLVHARFDGCMPN